MSFKPLPNVRRSISNNDRDLTNHVDLVQNLNSGVELNDMPYGDKQYTFKVES
jgi:hypothetical protein